MVSARIVFYILSTWMKEYSPFLEGGEFFEKRCAVIKGK